MSKRTIDAFFNSSSPVKRRKSNSPPSTSKVPDESARRTPTVPDTDASDTRINELEFDDPAGPASRHANYPHPIADFPVSILSVLDSLPSSPAKPLPPRANLDCLYFAPLIARSTARRVYEYLLSSLPFYRVKYTIMRGPSRTAINTPRYTTVFGVDDSARWTEDGQLVTTATKHPLSFSTYKRPPRPLPACLDHLRQAIEKVTGARYNFCLVNYYADGNDSISAHSDDERFLGRDPCIASISLGGTRDFHLKPKPPDRKANDDEHGGAVESGETIKLALGSGDMIVMRGPTQSNWLHAIPKRKGEQGKKGRINITFRRALIRQGTDNYYNYNVGDGPVWRWNAKAASMQIWEGNAQASQDAEMQTQVNWR